MTVKCDICGKDAKKGNTSHGMTLCCSCRGIIPGLTKYSENLLKIAQRLGKVDEVVDLFGRVTASACSEDARHDLEAVVQDARATLIKALPPAPESLDDTQSLFDIATLAEEAARHIAALTNERDRLADQAKAGGEAGSPRLDLWQTGSADPLDAALLRWAKRQYEQGKIRVQMEVVE